MKILPAEISDIPEILNLQKLSYMQEAEIYDDYNIPPLTQTIEELENEFARSTVLKAVIGHMIVGTVRAFIKNNRCHVGRLAVHPDRQNKGIGTELLTEIEKHFKDRGIAAFELFTGEKSVKNIYLYRKSGYMIFKTEKLNDKVNIVFLAKVTG